MKKIIFVIAILLLLIGCSSVEKKKLEEGVNLKNNSFQGAVKIRVEGRADRIFIDGDVVNLGREYYITPGEYFVSWNSRSYVSINVNIGGHNKNNDNDNDMNQRSKTKINIEKNSIIELKGDSANIINMGGEL